MPRVLFLDTEPYIVSALKRKFELEGFQVLERDSSEKPDLIVVGKQDSFLALPETPVSGSLNVPIIMLSNDPLNEDIKQNASVAQLKMPFRPSQLMAMARQAVTAVV